MNRRPLWQLAAVALLPLLTGAAEKAEPVDLSVWTKQPASSGFSFATGKATLTGDKWAFLLSPDEHADGELAATVTIQEPARRFNFFGQSWSAWPDPAWGEGGFEAGLLLRAGEDHGYRVQWSSKYQEVALVKYPDGGYVQSVPCTVKLHQPQRVAVKLRGNRIAVQVDGQEKIRYQDDLLPLGKGRLGVGVSSGAKVVFENVTIQSLPASPQAAVKEGHTPHFRVRQWLGGRPWVFDGDEPVLLLPVQDKHSATYYTQTVGNVKLLPGYKPLLNWNGHWDIANQGAFPEGSSKATEAEVRGGGETLTARWTGRQFKDRFATKTELVVGYDTSRGTYTYDVATELEVLGEPFQFRYGYDFEHHTPLDPFRWQYLVVKREDGGLYRRPVYPVDPGPIDAVASRNGLRMWYGRHKEKMVVAPAVEYDIADAGGRKLGTAVCAAFYDTGVSFAPETARPGTRVRVAYRYTGYPADEAEALFKAAKIYDSFMLDPKHHYIFADQWPKLTFSKFVPLSETWIYGRTPFMTGHNTRPTYELARDTGVGSGFAMKLGPGAYGKARLPIPAPLPKGRYLVTALARSDNAHGPGGRIELFALEGKSGKEVRKETHYLGNGSFAWKPVGFVSDLPSEAQGLAVALGNAGTGTVLITDVEFKRLEDGVSLPAGVSARAESTEPKSPPAPEGALADYRMEEGEGLHVYDSARGPFGVLELANLDWTVEEGRTALRFRDNTTGRSESPRAGVLERGYFSHPAYKDKKTTPVANAGLHGGGFELKAFTIATTVKPGARMPDGRGDVVGLGARRVILSVLGQKPPYKLGAFLNVSDSVLSDPCLNADRWYHLAMTGEPTRDKKWRVRLFVDGRLVAEGVTHKMDAPTMIPPSLILGTELFYMHSSYYRGLIGRTTVYKEALSNERIAELAAVSGK
jgi:hypothetical protein